MAKKKKKKRLIYDGLTETLLRFSYDVYIDQIGSSKVMLLYHCHLLPATGNEF